MENVEAVQRVMVACVTTEVIKVTDPAKKLGIDRIHLLNYVKKAEPNNEDQKKREKMYESVYRENLRILGKSKINVVEHRDVEIFDFDALFHTVYRIIVDERKKNSAVYVNISSGTPEYSAAASMASMMVDGVEIFSVGTKASGHTVPFEKQMENIMHDGMLVGSAFDVLDPIRINKFPLPTPDLKLLAALRIFDSIPISRRSNVNVINELMRNNEWRFAMTSEGPDGVTIHLDTDNMRNSNRDLLNKVTVQYQRSYIDRWKKEGWIEKSETNGKRYRLTEKGRRYINVFCSE